jgi:hypothetical protein
MNVPPQTSTPKIKYGDKRFIPFQSNLYEDVKVNENEESLHIRDSQVKGYVEPGKVQ